MLSFGHMVTHLFYKKNRSSFDNLLKVMVNFANRFNHRFQIVNQGKLSVQEFSKNENLLFLPFFRVFCRFSFYWTAKLLRLDFVFVLSFTPIYWS